MDPWAQNFFKLPIGASRNDIPGRHSDFDGPVYMTPLGHAYSFDPAAQAAFSPPPPPSSPNMLVNRTLPDGRVYHDYEPRQNQNALAATDILGGLAKGVANPFLTPGRALRGEPVTHGDVLELAAATNLGASMFEAPKGAVRSGAVRTADGLTPEQAQADDIVRLLREGRGADVTDDMMAQADPQELWRLYEDGATGQVMPMDQASRMARAREMGFDADLYHGTDGELRGAAFDNYASGRVDSGYLGRGTYASESPEIAAGYASRKASMAGAAGEPNVMPLSVRQGNQSTISPSEKQALSGMSPDDRMDWGFDRQREGINSVRVNYGSKRGGPGDEVVTFDPSNIRSRFARFDPRLAHLRHLSAGVGGAAVGLNALAPQQADASDFMGYGGVDYVSLMDYLGMESDPVTEALMRGAK